MRRHRLMASEKVRGIETVRSRTRAPIWTIYFLASMPDFFLFASHRPRHGGWLWLGKYGRHIAGKEIKDELHQHQRSVSHSTCFFFLLSLNAQFFHFRSKMNFLFFRRDGEPAILLSWLYKPNIFVVQKEAALSEYLAEKWKASITLTEVIISLGRKTQRNKPANNQPTRAVSMMVLGLCHTTHMSHGTAWVEDGQKASHWS